VAGDVIWVTELHSITEGSSFLCVMPLFSG
jgi:hypothetical protein